MAKIFSSVDQLVGNTPLLRLLGVEKAFGLNCKLVAKLESFNPGGSAKDRIAKNIVEDAERKGLLKQGSVIVEPTSGNTGIGLCAVAAAKGYRCVIVMPETMSEERRKIMKAYGAELVLTEGAKGMRGAIEKAAEIAKELPNSFMAGQFVNFANPEAHYKTTGPEIFEDTDGEVDVLVAGVGTGGTLSGAGKYIKERKPSVRLVAVEPKDSPVLSGGKAGAHKLQGIGAGFVPQVFDAQIVDEIFTVTTQEAYETCRLLGRRQGVLVGVSSGAAAFAAIEVAKRAENQGKTVVVVLPDTGERYLSTPGLFD